LAFITSEAFSPEVLTAYLQSEASEPLSRKAIPNEKNAFELRKFVIGNDALQDDIYRSYVRKLPLPFTALPDVGRTKIGILIEERKAVFSVDNFTKMDDDDLKALFIELNFDDYLEKKDEFSIDVNILERVLNSGLADPQKMAIISETDPDLVSNNPSLASAIGPVLDRSKIVAKDHRSDFIRAVILNSYPESLQISLFNKLHAVLTTGEVRDVLQGLPAPYRDIATYGRSPRIEREPINEQFASWLKERKIISSFAPTLFSDGIRISTFRKEPSTDE
jgi:hypothetical protein